LFVFVFVFGFLAKMINGVGGVGVVMWAASTHIKCKLLYRICGSSAHDLPIFWGISGKEEI